MKKTALILLLGVLAAAFAFGQDAPPPGDGLDELDELAEDLDTADDPAALLARLSASYGVPLADLEAYVAQGYKPGELWLALELAAATDRPLSEVVALAEGRSGHGWGLVAKVLGIEPGKAEFFELKRRLSEGKDRLAGARDGKSKPEAGGKGSDKSAERQKPGK